MISNIAAEAPHPRRESPSFMQLTWGFKLSCGHIRTYGYQSSKDTKSNELHIDDTTM
jgi:hypothetical protein